MGIISTTGLERRIVASENPLGYYMRADQFVYRMNPGDPSSPTNPRGATNSATIHITQWGKPVPPGTELKISQMLPESALNYTANTGGTLGITNVSEPQNVISINGNNVEKEGEKLTVTVNTDSSGSATFDLACTPPGNPREFVDGQVYFLEYEFGDTSIQETFVQDVNDKISILVYDETSDLKWTWDGTTTEKATLACIGYHLVGPSAMPSRNDLGHLRACIQCPRFKFLLHQHTERSRRASELDP